MAGRLLIADDTGDELFEIDPDGADSQGTRLRALPTALTAPRGMTVLSGRLLIADNTGDELFEIDPDGADSQGTRLRALPTALTSPQAMTVLSGRLLIADNTGDELFEIDPDGADSQGTRLRRLPTALTSPQAMTVLSGRLLIADTIGDELFEIDPDGADSQGTRLRRLPTALTAPFGMTVLSGRLLIADTTGDELFEIDPDGADSQGTRLRALPTALTSLFGMTVLPSPNTAPEVTGISADHDPISGGALVTLTPTVTDAEDALGTLTYEWTATGGVFTDPSAQNAMWTAPAGQTDAVTHTATLTVTDPGGLSDTGLILLIVLAAPAVAPSFTDSTGDAQAWMQGAPFTPITVPEANGTPAPTYAVEGALPAGLAFDPVTRVISGTPTDAGSGTITIRATNSAGMADWTVAYTTTAMVVAGALGIRYGGVTQHHMRYGGTTFTRARYGGVTFGGGGVPRRQ